jgi:uncharacterized protein YacL
MSDREYFSLRYTVPGFVFILTIVGLNYSNVLSFLVEEGKIEVFGLVISLISLFASSAVGFLIAQIHFLWFHKMRDYAKILKRNDIETFMQRELGWKTKDKLTEMMKSKDFEKKRDYSMGASLDYILLKSGNENIIDFLRRKIDLYHTMQSTLVSIYIGLIVGLIIRLLTIKSLSFNSMNLDNTLFISTLIAVILLIIFLYFLSHDEILFEYYPFIKLFICSKDAKKIITEPNFREVFKDYFEDKNPQKTLNHMNES